MSAAEPLLHTIAFKTAAGESRVSARLYEAESRGASPWYLFAHGAGAGQQHPFMVDYASALASRGVHVVTFNFPYTEQRRKVPDKNEVLEGCLRAALTFVADRAGGAPVFAGGKSMGGRIASQVAAQEAGPVRGLVFLGYPLHPPGQPAKLRTAHWPSIRVPMLFVQGERDAFASPAELEEAMGLLSSPAQVHYVENGDHSFKVPRRGGQTQAAVAASIQDVVAEWIHRVAREAR